MSKQYVIAMRRVSDDALYGYLPIGGPRWNRDVSFARKLTREEAEAHVSNPHSPCINDGKLVIEDAPE